MARPEVDWPIPVYVTELRERVVAVYRVPARALAGRLPAPLAPDLAGGHAAVALALGNGRCLKPVGGAGLLAREFRTAELLTPALWQPACRPAARGLVLLRLLSEPPGLTRLVRAALSFDPVGGALRHEAQGTSYRCLLQTAAAGGAELRVRRAVLDEPWPERSLFSSAEAAEAHLLHPACYFVPDRSGDVVRAVPVHQYARSTLHVPAGAAARSGLAARSLGLPPQALELDHVFFQKRCTHTWGFPPERIPVARPAARLLAA